MPKISRFIIPLKLSDDLAEIVGKKEASRAECIKQLQAYIKKNNLLDPENKQFFVPDKKMAKIFGTDKIRAFGMAKFLSAHLSEINIEVQDGEDDYRHLVYDDDEPVLLLGGPMYIQR